MVFHQRWDFGLIQVYSKNTTVPMISAAAMNSSTAGNPKTPRPRPSPTASAPRRGRTPIDRGQRLAGILRIHELPRHAVHQGLGRHRKSDHHEQDGVILSRHAATPNRSETGKCGAPAAISRVAAPRRMRRRKHLAAMAEFPSNIPIRAGPTISAIVNRPSALPASTRLIPLISISHGPPHNPRSTSDSRQRDQRNRDQSAQRTRQANAEDTSPSARAATTDRHAQPVG